MQNLIDSIYEEQMDIDGKAKRRGHMTQEEKDRLEELDKRLDQIGEDEV